MFVCVQGLGFVGSAMAIAIADCVNDEGKPTFEVCGVELDTDDGRQRVEAINSGKFPFKSTDKSIETAASVAHARNNLRATVDPLIYSRADVVVVDVHCDIDFESENPSLDLRVLVKAIKEIGTCVQPGCLILIETTVPPGTCSKVLIPVLEQCFVKRGLDPSNLCVAHSYERVMPGENYYSSIKNFWRVFAANNDAASKKCYDFLEKVINTKDYPLTELSSLTASETAKVLENSYRAANIAFITEWTEFCDGIGINLTEIIDAIRVRPTHSNIMYPGLGVGGYCLTKDPAFAPAAAKSLHNLDLEFPFSKLAMRRNALMPNYVVKRIIQALDGDISRSQILICGAAYRKNVGDTRFSPSEVVYRELADLGAVVDVFDPIVDFWGEVNVKPLAEFPVQKRYDLVLIAVPHDIFREMDLTELLVTSNPRFVLDAFSYLKREDKMELNNHKIKFFEIGGGNL